MLFGYARVSTGSQNLDMQIDMLLTHGVNPENIFTDKESGKKRDRKGFEELQKVLREGDKVIFFDLFRVGRDLKHLISIVETFNIKGIHFKDLTLPLIDSESIQTTNGEFLFFIFGAFGQFQRRNIVEKVKRGIASAKSRGITGGRPKGPSKKTRDKAQMVAKLYLETTMTIGDISKTLGIVRNTVYRCLELEGISLKIDENRRSKNAS